MKHFMSVIAASSDVHLRQRPSVIQRLVIIGTAALLAGCATAQFDAGLEQGHKLDPQRTYVYGRFQILDLHPIDVALNAYDSIGLRFSCERGQSFTVGFLAKDPEQVLEVPTDTCSLDQIVFTKGSKAARASPPPKKYAGPLLQKIRFERGSVNYLGDFEGRMKHTYGAYQSTTEWKVTDIKDRFRETTDLFRPRQAGFTEMNKVNQLSRRP